ncbi:MAG TPA: D-alanyl-D-alanine carboxypeptidase, partial [Gemmatimonadaceae bacterium]
MRVARIVVPAVLAAACATGGGARPAALAPSSRAAFRHAIDSMVSQREFRDAHFGVLIVNPKNSDTLYSLNAGKLFMPASNMKVITSTTALVQLGPDYTYRTDFA